MSSAYYMILAAEVGITLKLAREAYYAGAFAKLTNKIMEIYDEEEYIPIFVIDDVTQNIIIDTIPEVEPFIEVFPEKEETGNQDELLKVAEVVEGGWRVVEKYFIEGCDYYK